MKLAEALSLRAELKNKINALGPCARSLTTASIRLRI